MTYIYANFLHLHYISAKSYQPQDVRDFVESSWRMYPRNTRLLEIFVECERKFKLQHRVFTSIDEAFAGYFNAGHFFELIRLGNTIPWRTG